MRERRIVLRAVQTNAFTTPANMKSKKIKQWNKKTIERSVMDEREKRKIWILDAAVVFPENKKKEAQLSLWNDVMVTVSELTAACEKKSLSLRVEKSICLSAIWKVKIHTQQNNLQNKILFRAFSWCARKKLFLQHKQTLLVNIETKPCQNAY